MDGRNSFGRRISLLNDDVPTVSRKPSTTSTTTTTATTARYSPSISSRLASFAYSRCSSSGPSTPCLSPQTPPLIRSDSLDSSDMDAPSPLTPEYHGEGMETLQLHPASHLYHQSGQSAYFPAPPKNAVTGYPPMPSHNMPLPYPHHAQQPSSHLAYPPLTHNPRPSYDGSAGKNQTMAVQQQQQQQQQQQSRQQNELGARSAAQANRTKKGQHPCPLSKQFNCSDTFTTSGHASRHAKKHTGEKSAICPDCGKDFTRKDNMEQHRKTHLNGRNANKGRSGDVKSVGGGGRAQAPSSKRPKPSPLQSSGASQLDSPSARHSASPATPLSLQQQLPEFIAPSQDVGSMPITAYPDPVSCGTSSVYPGVPHDALHTLASAASGRFMG